MLSDHFRKVAPIRPQTLLLLAAGAVIVGQLFAMVLLVDGQVEKAESRKARIASASVATALCIENSRGAALRQCDPAATVAAVDKGADTGNATAKTQAVATLAERD